MSAVLQHFHFLPVVIRCKSTLKASASAHCTGHTPLGYSVDDSRRLPWRLASNYTYWQYGFFASGQCWISHNGTVLYSLKNRDCTLNSIRSINWRVRRVRGMLALAYSVKRTVCIWLRSAIYANIENQKQITREKFLP